MSETLMLLGGEIIITPSCRYESHGSMRLRSPRPGRYPFQCPRCGMRLLVCSSPTGEPTVYAWRMDCPRDMHFYDYVKQCMGDRVAEYNPGTAGVTRDRPRIQLSNKDGPIVAAPG